MKAQQTVVFFDLETGGLNQTLHPIIQISAIAVNWLSLETVDTFDAKVQFNPAQCEPDALKINGYTPEAWADAMPLDQALSVFSQLCREHSHVQMTSRAGNPYFVAQLAAYNAEFDMKFIQVAFNITRQFMPASYLALCMLQRARWFFAERPGLGQPDNFKLPSVCRALGVTLDKAHDAGADNRAQIAVLRRIRDMESLEREVLICSSVDNPSAQEAIITEERA